VDKASYVTYRPDLGIKFPREMTPPPLVVLIVNNLSSIIQAILNISGKIIEGG